MFIYTVTSEWLTTTFNQWVTNQKQQHGWLGVEMSCTTTLGMLTPKIRFICLCLAMNTISLASARCWADLLLGWFPWPSGVFLEKMVHRKDILIIAPICLLSTMFNQDGFSK